MCWADYTKSRLLLRLNSCCYCCCRLHPLHQLREWDPSPRLPLLRPAYSCHYGDEPSGVCHHIKSKLPGYWRHERALRRPGFLPEFRSGAHPHQYSGMDCGGAHPGDHYQRQCLNHSLYGVLLLISRAHSSLNLVFMFINSCGVLDPLRANSGVEGVSGFDY